MDLAEISDVSDLNDSSSEEKKIPSSGFSLPLWEALGGIALSGALFFSCCSIGTLKKKKVVLMPAATTPLCAAQTANEWIQEVAIEIPQKPKESISYHPTYKELHCTHEDKQKIGWIVTTVCRGGIDLLWKKWRLDAVGDEILHVHPYQFLSTILLDPLLRESLKQIFKDPLPFKKKAFLEGIRKGMERESNNLEIYIHQFASDMGTQASKIRPLMQTGDWNALVIHLLEKDPRLMIRTYLG